MEVSESEEPTPKTTTLESPNPNPNLDVPNQPPKFREEGELSSEDDPMLLSLPQEDQNLSVSQCNNIDGASLSVPVPPADKCSENVQVGKTVSGNSPRSTVDIQSQACTQPVAQKGFDKNRIPPKANNNTPGWCAPSGATNNLVIRFSDDDSSSSDSEERIKEKPAKSNSNTSGVIGVRKPPAPVNLKLNKQNSTAISKVMPQRFSFNRVFASSVTKMLGSNSSGAGVGALLAEQGSRVKNLNPLNKNMPNRERVPDRSMDLNNSKLQDLRQQIALRESELKLKSVQRNKESVPLRGDNATTNATRRFAATSSMNAQMEPKEPEKKRKKVGGYFSTQLNSVGAQEVSVGKSIFPSREPAMQKGNIPVSVKFDQAPKANSAGRTESIIDKGHKLNEKQVPGISGNIPSMLNYGGNTKSNCIQSDGNNKQTHGSIMLNQATSANMISQVSSMNLVRVKDIVELNPSKNQQSSSFSNKRILGKDLVQNNHAEPTDNKTLEPPLSNICQESESLWNCVSNASVAEYRSMNMQSLAEMEESLDKDLEEAQELRRRCEIEERNALKAYRKAQRALVEANAKCADLYQKREMYSVQLRSFIMGDSSLLGTSRQNDKDGIGSNDGSRNMLLLPSSHQLQPELDRFNPIEMGSNFHYLNSAPVQKSYQRLNGQTVGSEPCSEPDASTSEPLSHGGKAPADRFCSPSNDPNISTDEDDGSFSFENEIVQHELESRSKNNDFDDGEKNLSKEPSRELITDKPEDLMLLEATLRSELFARIGTRNSLKNSGSSDNIHLTFEQGTENDVSIENTPTNSENYLSSKAESEGGGPDVRERSNSEVHVEMQNDCSIETDCLNTHALVDPGKEGSCILVSDVSMSNVFRSAFSHLKIISPKTFMEWVSKNKQNYDREEDAFPDVLVNKFSCCSPTAESRCENNVGSYTCDIVVDPFWPLCMYELRGKCNNDECPWQHVRDNKAIVSHDQLGDSDCDAKAPRYNDIMASPTYLVGLDTLKVDRPSYESVLTWRNSQSWKKCCSLSLTPSNLFLRDLPLHGPLSCGGEGRIEVLTSWSRQSTDFMSRSDRSVSNQLNPPVADNEQALETAILIFTQEVDRREGMKKALPILSRALEADSTSVFLWILYLIIYLSDAKSVVADDMFSFAVKYNEGSYELWLMYINSRTHVDDRLATYDAALKALCRQNASTSNRDRVHASACILDLFLQMIECSCISGRVEKAIQKVLQLRSADTTNSDHNMSSPLLFDVHSRLTISDKSVFWLCCVYLVIYKKLPEPVVRQFECDKQLPEIQWSSILLPDDEKRRAIELVEKGADHVASFAQTESIGSDVDLRSARSFAVNHIRCMAAIDSQECCWNLLSKYLRLYPSCLELVLMSARDRKRDFEDVNFFGFEETIGNWPKGTPGIQCVWNQYAQLFLQNGQFEFGKELMDRWHRFAWTEHNQNEESQSLDCRIDAVFGFLNLSLYKLLQNDRIGARIAVDKALKAVTPTHLKYCIGEHAMFFLTEESLMKENASIGSVVNILKYHMGDYHRVFSAPEPLPRKFIDVIKKQRVKQLASNIFSPLPADFSLVNSVLEAWFGPSLLPDEFKEQKDLVDFVEHVLDAWPSNYELALSLCKLLSGRKNSTTTMLFWASSNLMSAIFHAVPIPPEHVWVETAMVLGKVKGIDGISQRFYRRALTAYPFSVNLWRNYQTFYVKMGGLARTIAIEAKAKGIALG